MRSLLLACAALVVPGLWGIVACAIFRRVPPGGPRPPEPDPKRRIDYSI